jgi:hydroxymethylbilane synthase
LTDNLPPNASLLRLGTRGSLLARAQSAIIASLLEKRHPGLQVELVLIRTSGDQITDQPLHAFGGKGLFTKELEQALLEGSIDFAVHSFKDVPVTMPLVDQSELVIAAVPQREDPRDVLVGTGDHSIHGLRAGAKVGTGSLRRRSQLLNMRPDLVVEPIRGNIDTRIRKHSQGDYDAIVLAMAGLKRAGLFDAAAMAAIDPSELLPAPGQGALALQSRRADDLTRQLLSTLDDPTTAMCVELERELVRLLGGDCHSPIAALAEAGEDAVRLRAAVGKRDGSPPVVTASVQVRPDEQADLVQRVYLELQRQGAMELLHGSN